MTEPMRKHVLVLGANPAWQKTVVCDDLKVGEVVRVRLEATGAAGKGFNTARAVRAFGVPVVLVSAAGPDALAWEEACLEEGLETRLFRIEGPIRTATTVRDLASRQVTEIVEEGPPARPDAIDALLCHLAECSPGAAMVVVAGTFAPGLAPRRVLEGLGGLSIPVILDSVPAIRALLDLDRVPGTLVLKLNESEWKAVFQQADLDAALAAAHRVWPRSWILATRGGEGAVLVDPERRRRILTGEPIDGAVELNPIGAGDAFTGGFAAALFRGDSIPDAALHGMAVARASCMNKLPARFSMEDVAISRELVGAGEPHV